MKSTNKNIFIPIISLIILVVSIICSYSFSNKKKITETNKLTALVISTNNECIYVQDNNNIIYSFNKKDISANIEDNIVIKYTGILDKNSCNKETSVISYETKDAVKDENGIPKYYLDDGMFSDYYLLAYNKLNELTLTEKIAQTLIVQYPDNDQKEILKDYQIGGYLFLEKDFKYKTKDEVKNMINELQNVSKIPILTAVDEEGGKVVRISSNLNLSSEKFKSSSELYSIDGFNKIREDTINKSNLLFDLGINLNLAPVIDVSTNPDDYIYERSFKRNSELTESYAETVIKASKEGKVSYTLKHFPGYGNNVDTHLGISIDNRSYKYILENDIPPFESGINSGAEAILISHNTINSIDADNPASLSSSIHNILRNDLNFTGIIITDDLNMKALENLDNIYTRAILAGNDLIITSNYKESINEIENSVKNGIISESIINKLAFRILAWKYYKGLMFIEK